MKLKLSSTTLLLFLLLGLGSWYFLYEKRIRLENKKEQEASSKLIPYSLEEIQELEIIHPQEPVISLKKSGDQWLIVSPIEDEADSSVVTSLATSLSNAKEERLIEENPSQLEPFGLDKPQLTLKISKDASASLTLKFGAQTQVGFGVYVQSSSKPSIIKTSKTLLTAFQKSLFEMRNKQLVSLSSPQMKEVEFQSAKGRFLVNRSEKGNWLVQGSPVNEARWNKLLSNLTQLKAKAVVSEKDKPLAFGLEKPVLKLWLSEGFEKPKKSLWFSQVGDKVFAKRDDKSFIYELDKPVLESLSPSVLELTDDHLLALNRFSVGKISITRPQAQFDLIKEGAVWKLSDLKADEKVDPGKIEGFLTELQEVTGKRTGTVSPQAPASKSLLSIELFENKDGQFNSIGKIELGKAEKNSVSGKSTYLPYSWTIPLDSFKNLDKTRTDFLETPVTAKPEEKKS